MALSDEQCQEIVEALIEQHIAEPDRTAILKWLRDASIAASALTELGIPLTGDGGK